MGLGDCLCWGQDDDAPRASSSVVVRSGPSSIEHGPENVFGYDDNGIRTTDSEEAVVRAPSSIPEHRSKDNSLKL